MLSLFTREIDRHIFAWKRTNGLVAVPIWTAHWTVLFDTHEPVHILQRYMSKGKHQIVEIATDMILSKNKLYCMLQLLIFRDITSVLRRAQDNTSCGWAAN
jgi:hypothetical protein